MNPWIVLLALAAFGLGIWLTFFRKGGAAAHPAPTYVVQLHVRGLDGHGTDHPVSSHEPIIVHHLESARRVAWRLRQEHRGAGGTYPHVTITDEHGDDVAFDG